MRRLLTVGLVVSLFAASVTSANAFGGRRSRGCNTGCNTGCNSGCGGSACGTYNSCGGGFQYGGGYVDACGTSGAAMTYTEQTITAYRPVMKTRTVPRTINKVVGKTVQEPYTYTEMVQEVTPQKRTETYYITQTKQVPYKYTVNVPVMTPQKQMQTVNNTVTKQVPYTYNVTVPVMTQQKQMQTFYTCVPQQITEQRPVCRTVRSQCVDPCTGCCHNFCHNVTEMQTCTRTVMQSVPQTREVMVNVCNYQTEQRQGTRTVCETVPAQQEVTVNVCTWKTEEREGTRLVCETVPQTREVTYNVVSYKPVQKSAYRQKVEYENVQETVNVTENYTEMEAYQTTVRVPSGACGTGYVANNYCGDAGYGCRDNRGCGFFGGMRGGCGMSLRRGCN
jgi:hypothetical protein